MTFQRDMEKKLTNPEVIPGMFALDVFICNRDRHEENVLFQRPSPDSGRYTCYLIDHSHALIGDFPNFGGLLQFMGDERNPDPKAFLRMAPRPLRGLVRRLSDFEPWVTRIEALSRTQLQDSLTRVPQEWKPAQDDCPALVDFLIQRKNTVRGLLEAGSSLFPALEMRG
jgi:hypothetical protein